MNENTRQLHDLGQRIWLDNSTLTRVGTSALQKYINEFAITGLTLDLTGFERAIGTGAHDGTIRSLQAAGLAGEELLFELALESLAPAADLFLPTFEASGGVDGWVSLEVSPLLADNTAHTIQAANRLFERAAKANLFVKIPGTPEGVRAVEEAIVDGVPVNVTLLFSREHYLAAAEAYMRGIERRLAAGLDPKVASVCSVLVSSWDAAVKAEISSPFHHRLGIAMAMRTYQSHMELLASDRWHKLAVAGAVPQRLSWTNTNTRDPAVPDTLYVETLAAPDTIAALSEKVLLALVDHGHIGQVMPADGGYADAVLEEFRREGVDDVALADRLQREGVEAQATSWHAMLSRIAEKSPS